MLVDRRRDFNHENVIGMPSRAENDARRSPHCLRLMARSSSTRDGTVPAQVDGMTRVCAWCNTVDGSGDLRPRPGDPVSHTMCPLCSVEHFFYTLLLRGRSYLRNLAHR